jgi:hypothetical protein
MYTVKPVPIISEDTMKKKRMPGKDSRRKFIYMRNVQGQEKMNDICVTTMHVETMHRGFTVL